MIVDLWAIQPDKDQDYELVARCARVCHKSAGNNDTELLAKLIEWGHLSVFEHIRTATLLENCDINLARAQAFISFRYGMEISKRDGAVLISLNGRNSIETTGTYKWGRTRHLAFAELSPEEKLIHGAATFYISGISRACSHQLVRHRVGCSYSQESMRYCNVSDNGIVVPDSVKDNALWHSASEQALAAYKALIDSGVPMEDARMILPIATKTSMAVTMTFQALQHFFEMRISKHAQWEIRQLAERMRDIMIDKVPEVFDNGETNAQSKNPL